MDLITHQRYQKLEKGTKNFNRAGTRIQISVHERMCTLNPKRKKVTQKICNRMLQCVAVCCYALQKCIKIDTRQVVAVVAEKYVWTARKEAYQNEYMT